MIGRFILIAAALAASGSSAGAEPRQPTQKWVVNYADAQCIASRSYGTEADPLHLVLKAPVLGDMLQLGIIRNGSKPKATQVDGEIIFNSAPSFRTSLLEFGAKGSNQRALLAKIPSEELKWLQSATTLQIRARGVGYTTTASRMPIGGGGGADETFAVTQMSSVLKVLDSCTADLRKVWHVWTEEGQSPGLKEGAKANLMNHFKGDDYPDIALYREQVGSVGMVLLVDEQGKVADCTIEETTGIAALDAQSCAIVKERAKFAPAIGLDGKPAKSSFRQRITWRLE